MSVNEYRISKSREEIIKLVQKKFESENLMTIWQKDPKNSERVFKCDVKFSSLDSFEGVFSIAIDEAQKRISIPILKHIFYYRFRILFLKQKLLSSMPVSKTLLPSKFPTMFD